mgnify:CR=1 FL=1|jgi:hypothetical protein
MENNVNMLMADIASVRNRIRPGKMEQTMMEIIIRRQRENEQSASGN